MTIPIKASEFEFEIGLPNYDIMTCAWRGACIELFARVEREIVDCLETLGRTGYSIDGKARHEAPKIRLRALKTILEQSSFDGHSKPALKKLDEWLDLLDARDWIVHGSFAMKSTEVRVDHFKYKKQVRTDTPTLNVNLAEMMGLLARFDKGQRELHQALGQIKASASRSKP